jgi:hypothetical protein
MARCLQVPCRRFLRERGCSFLTLFVDVSVPILGTGLTERLRSAVPAPSSMLFFSSA